MRVSVVALFALGSSSETVTGVSQLEVSEKSCIEVSALHIDYNG